jgi:peptidoglycan/xylan/chitin deacetylase (PgdA/CDA1 family)
MIKIFVAKEFYEEIDWVSYVIFHEFLGLDYRVELFDNQDYFDITIGKNKVSIKNIFLLNARSKWLSKGSIPNQEIEFIKLSDFFSYSFFNEQLPIFFGKSTISRSQNNLTLDFDILGTIFFLLSGYEDAIKEHEDKHNRHKFSNSILSNSNLIDRPVVDEYVDLLWKILFDFEPSLKKKDSSLKLSVSCDVDNPYSEHVNSSRASIRKLFGDVIKRKSLFMGFINILNFVMSKFKIYYFDPLDKFNWMMKINEKLGNRITFFFITMKSNKEMDGHYSINEKRIRKLLKEIHSRGHEIGLHSSYNSYLDSSQLLAEKMKLQDIFSEEGIYQSSIGNRQHYLKLSSLKTFGYLDSAGISYDSSICFAERIGFRCGTAKTFSMFDLTERKKLNILQKPLLIMEDSLLGKEYMAMEDQKKIIDQIMPLKDGVDYFGGEFTLLWHNSSLNSKYLRDLYVSILKLF